MRLFFMVFIFLVVSTGSLTARAVDEPRFSKCNPYGTIPCHPGGVDRLVNSLAIGFARALSKESSQWYICGERIEKKSWIDELAKIARALLYALDERGLDINPWGPWGVIYKESRGNRCAIGPNPRKAAYKYKLIKEKAWYLWSEDEIVNVVTHRKWGKKLADLGLGQVVWKREARVLENGIERIPTAREMLSLNYGVRVLAHSMEVRTRYRYNRRWKHMPWLFWPGTKPHIRYGHDVQRIVRKMEGPYNSLR